MTLAEIALIDQAEGQLTDEGFFEVGELRDVGDVLRRLSALLAHRRECIDGAHYHQRPGGMPKAYAGWLADLERTNARIEELLPEAFRLLTAIKSQITRKETI